MSRLLRLLAYPGSVDKGYPSVHDEFAPATVSGIDDLQIDWSFISQREGGQWLSGYVPAARHSKSGVTIATGFDLGARNLAELKHLGFGDVLIKKVEAFLNLQGVKAEKALAQAKSKGDDLVITKSEADQIDKAGKKQALTLLIRRYNRSSSTRFSTLPPEAQTVIASVAFQYGNFKRKLLFFGITRLILTGKK